MKKIILLILITMSLFLFTACNDQQYFDKNDVSALDVDKELEKVNEMLQARVDFAAKMGIDLDEYDIPDPERDYNENGKYAPLPHEFFSMPEKIRDRQIGKRFYCLAMATEIMGSGDDYEYADLIMMWEGLNEMEFMFMKGTPELEGWQDIEIFENMIIYFTYAGISDIANRPYGIYEHHEPFTTNWD